MDVSSSPSRSSPLKLNLVVSCVCAYIHSPPGGITKIGSDPVKAVNDAVEGSANVIGVILKFAANLIAPDEDEGTGMQTC